MTFYKYAEREANSQIDWSAISKGLSDTITKIDTLRQQKKAAIEEETRAEIDKLANAPAGESKTATEWALKYADDMQQYRLILSRKLKSGQMSLKDYQIATQNGKASTEMLFKVVQEYQDKYKELSERRKTSSVFEPELAALNESYGNIANTSPYINPTNGMVYLASIKDGVDGVQAMGDNYVSLQALRNRINTKIDKVDAQSEIKAKTDLLGEKVVSEIARDKRFRQTGVVTEITDPTLRTNYEKFRDATVNSLTEPGYQLASILGDNMVNNPRTGKQYRATYNKAEFDADKSGDLILFGSDPGDVKFKDEQIEDAKKYISEQMDNYLVQKVEKRPFSEASPTYAPQSVVEGADAKKRKADLSTAWQLLRTGTQEQKKNAAEAISASAKAQGKELIDLDFNNGVITLTYSKESGIPPATYTLDGNTSGIEWQRKGSEIFGDDIDLNNSETKKKFVPQQSPINVKRQYTEPVKPLTMGEKYKAYIDRTLVDFKAIPEDEDQALSAIQSIVPNDLGFSFETAGFGYDAIEIKSPDGVNT